MFVYSVDDPRQLLARCRARAGLTKVEQLLTGLFGFCRLLRCCLRCGGGKSHAVTRGHLCCAKEEVGERTPGKKIRRKPSP